MVVSFSRLSSIDQCPYQYYLTYVKECGSCKHYDQEFASCANEKCIYFGRDVKTNACCDKYRGFKRKDNAFAQCGSLVHEIMEGYAKDRFMLGELGQIFEDNFSNYVTEKFPPNKFVDLKESYYTGSYDYLDNFEGFDGYEIVGSEIEFTYEVCGDHLHGVIDLLLRDKKDGELVLYDYKSKSSFKSNEEKKKYARQLYLYSEYVKQNFGKYPKAMGFILFRKNKKIAIPFNKDDLNEAFVWVTDQLFKIKNTEEFPARYDEFFCDHLCSFSESCAKKNIVLEDEEWME